MAWDLGSGSLAVPARSNLPPVLNPQPVSARAASFRPGRLEERDTGDSRRARFLALRLVVLADTAEGEHRNANGPNRRADIFHAMAGNADEKLFRNERPQAVRQDRIGRQVYSVCLFGSRPKACGTAARVLGSDFLVLLHAAGIRYLLGIFNWNRQL